MATIRNLLFQLRSAVFIFLLGGAIAVQAQVEFYTPFNSFNFGTWSGQGNLSLSQTACISYRVFIFYLEMNYRLRASPATGSQYILRNGSNNLPFSLDVTDLHAAGTQTLSPAVYSSNLLYDPYCADHGPNAQLTMGVSQAALYSVPSGTYTVSLNLAAQRTGSSDTATQSGLTGTVTIPKLIRISGINDISLGIYDGVSPSVSYNEPYCIYTNTSAYRITPSSTTVGAAIGSFALDSGGNKLQYSVRVSNTANASSGTLLTNGQISGSLAANQSTPLSLNCNNGNNAAVYLQFGGSQLQSAPPGNYSGVLNLMVSPI